MLRCSLHPATQYAMRHSDVQMTSFGTDHRPGSWLWSVIPYHPLMQVRWLNIFRTKTTEGNAFLSLDHSSNKAV